MVKKYSITVGAFLEGILTNQIENGLEIDELYIPRFFVYYFEDLKKNSILRGDIGLNELSILKDLSKKKKFKFVFFGDVVINLKNIDTAMREDLKKIDKDVIVFVADDEEKKIYDIFDINSEILKIDLKQKKNPLKAFFDENTMSVHFKEGDFLYLKKGSPKQIEFQKSDIFFERSKIIRLIDEIHEFARFNANSYIEKDSGNVVLAQLEDVRTVIVRPPLSEGYEITAVRPVKKLVLSDYNLDNKIIDKLNVASGVLISGSPGSGKSTFCQALAEHLADLGKIVKTIESPRDLQLSSRITQFSLSHSKKGDLANILLLSRPDYSIYDELRNPDDITLYADLRLAGVGMVGVLHATKPIDSIHRLIGKVEMGMIPQIVDTVIFINKGIIEKIFVLDATVKVPAGMTESDLARPVIEIKDYLTNLIEYEIYTYGEQTVVLEIAKISNKNKESNVLKIAREKIEKELKKLVLSEFEFEFESDSRIKLKVPENYMSSIIGKQGKNIEKLEKTLGINITMDKLIRKDKKSQMKKVEYSLQQTKTNLVFYLKSNVNYIEIHSNGTQVMAGNVGRKGVLKIKRKSDFGKIVEKLLDEKKSLEITGF